ncbi:hypothetical protein MNBD_IGNAVI01-1311 [hydrothermal vent metagenome]|uniref:DUF306 domain-containing protein n=1 Tax=hydrothermal vent metagenome TaxID=652676 RepID=A0A3B1C8G8_9ZZZZ
MKRIFLVLLSLTLLNCNGTKEKSNTNEIKPVGPSTYYAEIIDNNGKKEVTLNFLDGMNFMLKEVSVDKNNQTIISIGTIELDTTEVNIIILKSAAGAKKIRIKNKMGKTLALLDVNGKEMKPELKRKENFEPITDPFPMKGMFAYMADAPLFVECFTKMRFPVAMEGDYKNLEKEYLANVEEPGKPILTTLTGSLISRPKMEGKGEILYLVVEKFDKVWPKRDCRSSLSTANLKNTYWKLLEINGEEIKIPSDVREPHFILRTDGKAVKGFGGCNNFMGSYKVNGNKIEFGPMAGTRKFCKETMEIENAFMKVFSEANNYKIFGEQLELYHNDKLIAKFESVYF